MQVIAMETWQSPGVNYTDTFYVLSYFFLHQTLEEGQGEGLRYKRAFEGLISQQQTIIHSTVKKRRALSSSMQTEFLLNYYRVVKMIKEFNSNDRQLMSKMP